MPDFTTLKLWANLVQRRDTRLGRMGLDSVAIAIVYAGGLILLYPKR